MEKEAEKRWTKRTERSRREKRWILDWKLSKLWTSMFKVCGKSISYFIFFNKHKFFSSFLLFSCRQQLTHNVTSSHKIQFIRRLPLIAFSLFSMFGAGAIWKLKYSHLYAMREQKRKNNKSAKLMSSTMYTFDILIQHHRIVIIYHYQRSIVVSATMATTMQ